MHLRERIIPNSEMADVNSNFNSAVEASLLELERLGMSRVLRNKKVKAISTLASGQDLLAVLKPTPRFTSWQNAACSNTFFFWRVDYALEGSVAQSMFGLNRCDFLFSLFPRPPRSLWLAPFPPLFGSFNMALSREKHSRTRRKRLHCRLKYKLIRWGVFSYSSL